MIWYNESMNPTDLPVDDYRQLLERLTPEVYHSLKRAVELGKWPDGQSLSDEQRRLCMEAVIAYEHRHLPPEERTGYIAPRTKGGCGDTGDSPRPLRWQ